MNILQKTIEFFTRKQEKKLWAIILKNGNTTEQLWIGWAYSLEDAYFLACDKYNFDISKWKPAAWDIMTIEQVFEEIKLPKEEK